MRMALWGSVAVAALAMGCRKEASEAPDGGLPSGATRSVPGAEADRTPPATPAQTPPLQGAPATAPGEAGRGAGMLMVPCESPLNVESALASLIDRADADQDGRVSRDEASAFTSFLVGGFFFRADADANGVVTPEEGRQARAEFFEKYPAVGAVFREVRGVTGQSPFATIAGLLDVEYGKPLSTAEARAAARQAVNDLYAVADTNKDSSITVAEVRQVGIDAANALGAVAFQQSDADANGRLSLQEFQAALAGPARVAFGLADRDNDGQLTRDEASVALAQATRRLGLPAAVGAAEPPPSKGIR